MYDRRNPSQDQNIQPLLTLKVTKLEMLKKEKLLGVYIDENFAGPTILTTFAPSSHPKFIIATTFYNIYI